MFLDEQSALARGRHCFAPIRCHPSRALLVGMVARKANRSVLEYQRSRGRPVPRSSGRGLIGVPGRAVLLAGVALGGLSRGPRRAGSRTRGNFRQSRLGPEPESATVELGSQVQVATLMEMGVNAALANADPTTGALQAAYRSFRTGSTASLTRLVTRELIRKLEREVRLRFAADMDYRRLRAAAVKSLVDAGVDLTRAMSLVSCLRNPFTVILE